MSSTPYFLPLGEQPSQGEGPFYEVHQGLGAGGSSPSLLLPAAAARGEPSLRSSLHAVATTNLYWNVLLLLFPLGIASSRAGWGDVSTFLLNLLAILPLAKMLDLATEQLSARVGSTLAGLLNATFGNAVELILGIMGLRQGLILVIQASCLGSILSNLLFILGLCFFCGGLKHNTQSFNKAGANVSASLLVVVALGFILPTAFSYQIGNQTDLLGRQSDGRVIAMSDATAILLFGVYVASLYFQIVTHKHIYEGPTDAASVENGEVGVGIGSAHAAEEERPLLSLPVAIGTLLASTVLIAVSAEFLLESVEGLSAKAGISETFIGLIVLPLAGNAAEHVTAISAAMRNQMDLAIGIALGSSLQIALCVTPLFVMLGWAIGQPMTLVFGGYDAMVLTLTILIVNYLIQDGESNWLEGFLLLMAYLVVAVSFFFLQPEDQYVAPFLLPALVNVTSLAGHA